MSGSRGANGVRLITTTGGNKNQAGLIRYAMYYGRQRPPRLRGWLYAREYATLQNEAYIAAGKTPLPEFANPDAMGEGTDWQEAIFESAPIVSHQLTFAGGGNKSSYSLAGNFFSKYGIFGVVYVSCWTVGTSRLCNFGFLKGGCDACSRDTFFYLFRYLVPFGNSRF